jgi:hypothetical protein
MVCVVVPLLLKRNIGVFLESSEVLAVIPPLFLPVMILFRCDVQLILLYCALGHSTTKHSITTTARTSEVTN